MKKIILALCSLALLSGCGNKGAGEKNGTITKLGTSGIFCTSNEMEIVRGGLSAGTGVNGASFDVTIEDPALLKIATDAIHTGAEVQITYRTELISFCRSDSHSNFLTSIRIIRPGIAADSVQKTGAQPVRVSGSVVSATQFQQMIDQQKQAIDNQTRSIDQTERLVRAVEASK